MTGASLYVFKAGMGRGGRGAQRLRRLSVLRLRRDRVGGTLLTWGPLHGHGCVICIIYNIYIYLYISEKICIYINIFINAYK